jgi:hypothetical protein
VSANQASTIVFPMPVDLLRPLIEAGAKPAAPEAEADDLHALTAGGAAAP